MGMFQFLRRSLPVLTVAVTMTIAKGQSDDSNATLSLDPDEQVQMLYAVYGGQKDNLADYTNVTDKVSDLLQKSADGFAVTDEAVLGKHSDDLGQSLLVLYNYEQRSFFCNLLAGGDRTMSIAKLKSYADAHKESHIGAAIPTVPDRDFNIVFAAYGTNETFFNVTDQVKSALRDYPDGFPVNGDTMGPDPHSGWIKILIVVFDDTTGRHHFSLYCTGPKVSKASITDAAQGN
jgi:hypothetical protein